MGFCGEKDREKVLDSMILLLGNRSLGPGLAALSLRIIWDLVAFGGNLEVLGRVRAGLGVIVARLEDEDEGCVEAALGVLFNVAADDACAGRVPVTRVIKAGARVLHRAQAAENVCTLLGNLASVVGGPGAAVCEHGGVGLLARALEVHPGASGVAEAASAALWNLALDPALRGQVATALPQLVEAARVSHSAEIARYSLRAIVEVSKGDAFVLALPRDAAMGLSLGCLGRHGGQNDAVCLEAVHACLAVNAAWVDPLACATAVCDAASAQLSSSGVQVEALRVLSELVERNGLVAHAASEELAARVLASDDQPAVVLEQACRLARVLRIPARRCAHGLAVALRLFGRFNGRLAVHACAALRALSGTSAYELVDAGVLEAALPLVQSGSSAIGEEALDNACALIANLLAAEPALRPAVRSLGGRNALLHAITRSMSYPGSALQSALVALGNLGDDEDDDGDVVGVREVQAAAALHDDNAAVLEAAFAALLGLTARCEGNRKFVDLHALVAAIRRFPGRPGLLENACGVLANCAATVPDPDELIDLAERNRGSTELLRNIICCLANYPRGREAARRKRWVFAELADDDIAREVWGYGVSPVRPSPPRRPTTAIPLSPTLSGSYSASPARQEPRYRPGTTVSPVRITLKGLDLEERLRDWHSRPL
jgi:hypothetical protein